MHCTKKHFLFPNVLKEWSFQKNRTGIWSFFVVLSGKMIFLFPENMNLFLRRKMKDDLSQEIHGNMIFSRNIYIYIYCYKYDITLLQNKSKMTLSRKNTLKGDWHPRSYSRKSSSDSLNFYKDLHRRFHILLSCEKKPGNLVYWIEICLLFFNLFGWRYSTMKNLQYSVPFSPQELYWEVCLSAD